MGKSAVLKDLFNRPAGYVRFTQERVMIRAPLDEAARMRIVFADGSCREYELSCGSDEQRFLCERKDAVGCCVFRQKELLLVSDDAMRRMFERQACTPRAGEPDQKAQAQRDERTDSRMKTRETDVKKAHVFAQRRWPPPPCWETARYTAGIWQEK